MIGAQGRTQLGWKRGDFSSVKKINRETRTEFALLLPFRRSFEIICSIFPSVRILFIEERKINAAVLESYWFIAPCKFQQRIHVLGTNHLCIISVQISGCVHIY